MLSDEPAELIKGLPHTTDTVYLSVLALINSDNYVSGIRLPSEKSTIPLKIIKVQQGTKLPQLRPANHTSSYRTYTRPQAT